MGFEDLPPNSKLTKDTCKIICREIGRGVPYKYACMMVGIVPSTLSDWIRRGKSTDDDDDPYRIFYINMQKAKASAVAYRVDGIRKAGEGGTWQSHAWWLERMANEDFGRRQVIEANVDANVKQVNLADLFDKEEILSILKEEKEEE